MFKKCIILILAVLFFVSGSALAGGGPPKTLTVYTSEPGTVTLNPPGGSYASDTVVTLTAVADPCDPCAAFSEWQGDLTGSTNPDTITMSSDKTVTAVFTGSGGALDEYGYLILTGDYWAHDPIMIREDDTYYVFTTGARTPYKNSTNLNTLNWTYSDHVWPESGEPSWWLEEVHDFDGNIWAPDVEYFNGKYHVYYTISKWATNESCIGLATATDLDGPWTDQGPVICSEGTNWNVIDPAIFVDGSDVWLSFGSCWSGIWL